MTTKVLVSKDFGGNQVLGFRAENLGAAPTTYGAGHSYYDTALGMPRVYNGTAWKGLLARGDQTGTQLAVTISDFATTAQSYSLDLFAAPVANLNLNSKRITNLADPQAAQDAATQNYVISQVQSATAGISSKDAVNALAASNISTMSGTATIDNVALVAGNRVLLTAQTTASQNGPWVVGAGAWTRPVTEGGVQGELDQGALWLVLGGTQYGGTMFRLATTGAITVGTTAVSIVQFATPSTVTAGNGLLNSSGTFSVKLPASSGLISDTTGIYIDKTIVATKYSATIGDGTATSYPVNHLIGSRDVSVQVYTTASPYATVEVDVQRTDANNVLILFASAPAAGAYRVVVTG